MCRVLHGERKRIREHQTRTRPQARLHMRLCPEGHSADWAGDKRGQTRTKPPGKAAHARHHPKARLSACDRRKKGGLGLTMTTHSDITQLPEDLGVGEGRGTVVHPDSGALPVWRCCWFENDTVLCFRGSCSSSRRAAHAQQGGSWGRS